jgi:ankyrin repeat protein
MKPSDIDKQRVEKIKNELFSAIGEFYTNHKNFEEDLFKVKLKRAIGLGMEIDSKNKEGYSLLIKAADVGNDKALNLLLDNNADINGNDNEHQITPLMKAANRGSLSCLNVLIERGADINKTDKTKKTALTDSTIMNKTACSKALIKAGADVNTKDSFKRTPLIYSTIFRNPEATELLIENGADVHAKDCEGTTAMGYAQKKMCADCEKIIEKELKRQEEERKNGKHITTTKKKRISTDIAKQVLLKRNLIQK